jgi:hypothetical protein
MKMTLLLFLSAILSLGSASAAAIPPIEFQNAFGQKFPNASKASWYEEEKVGWRVEFLSGGRFVTAKFNDKAEWTKTKTVIKVNRLPKVIKESISANYTGWKITKCRMYESKKNGVTYKVVLEKALQAKVVEYREDGFCLYK